MKTSPFICAFIFVLILSTIFSCDRGRKISISNKSDEIIVYKSTNLTYDPIMLQIPPNEKRYILFGFGTTWDKEKFSQYLNSLQNLEIIRGSDTITMTTKNEIKAYFEKRLKKLTKFEAKLVEQ